MQLFSKEWWKNAFAAQAELEGQTLTAQLEQTSGTRTIQISDAHLAQIEQSAAPIAPQQAAADPAIADRLAELEAQLSEQQAQARQAQAAAFADGAVRARHAMPAERQALYDAFVQASEDDTARPLATSRISGLETLVGSRTPHSLTDELIATNEAGALPSSTATAKPSEERIRALLSMTPLGQAALDRKRSHA